MKICQVKNYSYGIIWYEWFILKQRINEQLMNNKPGKVEQMDKK